VRCPANCHRLFAESFGPNLMCILVWSPVQRAPVRRSKQGAKTDKKNTQGWESEVRPGRQPQTPSCHKACQTGARVYTLYSLCLARWCHLRLVFRRDRHPSGIEEASRDEAHPLLPLFVLFTFASAGAAEDQRRKELRRLPRHFGFGTARFSAGRHHFPHP
jgi:hypothetical protein